MTHTDQTPSTFNRTAQLKSSASQDGRRHSPAKTLSNTKEEAQKKSAGFENRDLTGIVTLLSPGRFQVYVTAVKLGQIRVGSSQLFTFNEQTQFTHDYGCFFDRQGSVQVGQQVQLKAIGRHASVICLGSTPIRGLTVQSRKHKNQLTIELTHIGGLSVNALSGFDNLIEVQCQYPLPPTLSIGQSIESSGHFRTGSGPNFVLDKKLTVKKVEDFEAESILLVSTTPLQFLAQGKLTGLGESSPMSVAITLSPDVSIIVKRGEMLLQLSEDAFYENFEAHQLNSIDIDGEYDEESRSFIASLIIINS
ncbi:MAG: hypothetical protein P1V97_19900 [Planctomycetota bacterium]|nr:hypothetical protein [Planctomycetota bacterium]